MAKTGSFCCVAARPQGLNATSRDWPVGPHEPYWQTNTSFSPPPSRWDFRLQSEALSFGSPDGTQFMVSDTAVPYFSSPSDISPAQQWTPTTIREISTDEYDTSRRDVVLGSLSFSPRMEDTSEAGDSGGSTSLRSESSCDYESMVTAHSSLLNFASRHCFMSTLSHFHQKHALEKLYVLPLIFPS